MDTLSAHPYLSVRALACALLCVMLAGCIAQGLPVVAERSYSKNDPEVSHSSGSPVRVYQVRKGDTLYSIAWRYRLEHRLFAQANGIRPPYTIYPGQQLRLTHQMRERVRGKVSAPSQRQGSTAARTSTGAKPASKSQERTVRPPQVPQSSPSRWVWPLPADRAGQYDGRGYNFKLAPNDKQLQALAVGSGRVVYSGNGIGGHERLIILQHSAELLSAYGFNGRALVSEQRAVKAGEPLADIDSTGRKPTYVHFEIRRNGQPIDPSTLLK